MSWGNYLEAQVRLYTPYGTLIVQASETPRPQDPFPPVIGDRIYVVTAHNPDGVTQDREANNAAHGRLIAELAARGYEFWDADGGDVSWTHVEQSVALLGVDDKQAVELGVLFQQEAIFGWTPEAWTLVECHGDNRLVSHYRSSYDSNAQALQEAAALLGLDRVRLDRATLDHSLSIAHKLVAPDDAARAHRLLVRHANRWKRRISENERLAQEFSLDPVVAASFARKRESAARRAHTMKRKNELVGLGWPRSWTVQHVDRFASLGGTVELARAFEPGGWTAGEVIKTAEFVDGATNLVVPNANKERHTDFGDSLISIQTKTWPPIDSATVLSVRRILPSGVREAWLLDQLDGRTHVHHWSKAANGAWDDIKHRHFATPSDAFVELSELSELRDDHIAEYALAGPDVTIAWLLNALKPVTTGRAARDHEWEDDVADRWQNVDERSDEIVDLPLGNEARLFWATIAGYTVAVTRHDDTPLVLLLDDDDYEVDWTAIEVLAEHSWHSESGGAPTSWDGGDSLSLIHPRFLLSRTWGDIERESEVLRLPDAGVSPSALVADWIRNVDAEVPAALHLEPLDPDHHLTADQREQWMQCLDGLTVRLSLEVSDEILDEIRAHLSQPDSAYLSTKNALANPDSLGGQQLGSALNEAAEDGVIGAVLQWPELVQP